MRRPNKRPPAVLDVGETGYNVARGGQGLRHRLRGHERQSCWEQHRGEGTLAFAVLYEADGEIRLRVEKALRWDHRPPCGTDPWHLGRPGMERR